MLKIASVSGATTEEIQKLNQVQAVVAAKWSSDEFKALIYGHTYLVPGTITPVPGFSVTMDDPSQVITPDEVWAKMQGPDVTVAISIYTPPWYKRMFHNNVEGYEDDQGVHINRTFFDHEAVSDAGDTLVHEGCHALGYVHDYEDTVIRPYSVPYACGDLMAQLLLGITWN